MKNTHKVLLIIGIILFAGLALPQSAHATAPVVGPDPGELFHLPPQKPTPVEIGLYMIEITSISEPSAAFPTFSVDMFIDLRWQDPRVEFDPAEIGSDYEVFVGHAAQAKLDEIWWPDFVIENESGKRSTENVELIIFSDGRVEYEERFNVTVETTFNLLAFPFDEQDLEIDIESFEWAENELVFTVNPSRTGYDPDAPLMEWDIIGLETEIRSEKEIRADESFSELIFSIHVERKAGFYIWKILLPFFIIVNLSWSIFWMTGEGSSGRMGRTYVAILTVVAFHRVVAGYLPRMSAITFTDALVLVVYASLVITVVENIIVHRKQQADDAEGVERIDRIARWAVPSVVLIALLVIALAYLL